MDDRLREQARSRASAPGAPRGGMHPATRAVLQSEVRKVYGKQGAKSAERDRSPAAWWFRWQGLVALGSCVVVAGLGVLFWARSQGPASRMELARVASPPPAELAPTVPAPPAAADTLATRDAPTPAAAPTVTSPAPTPAPKPRIGLAATSPTPVPRRIAEADLAVAKQAEPVSRAGASVTSESLAAKALPEGTEKPAAPPAVAAAATAPQTTQLAAGGSADSQSLNLYFRNLAPTPAPAEPPSRSLRVDKKAPAKAAAMPVLNEFQVSLRDGQVQVIDQDGSVYTGSLLPVNVNAGQKAESRRAKAASDRSVAASPQSLSPLDSYKLDAVGTNRSLQQTVRISGFLSNTGPGVAGASAQNAALADTGNAGKLGLQQSATPPPSGGWQMRSTVKVGGRSQVLNASEVPAAAAAGNLQQNQR